MRIGHEIFRRLCRLLAFRRLVVYSKIDIGIKDPKGTQMRICPGHNA